MPGWQAFTELHKAESDKFAFLSVAADAQGAQAAAPFVEKAKATYPALLDSGNVLGLMFGYDLIPNGFFIDERGVLRKAIIGGFEVSDPKTMAAVDAFLAEPPAKEEAKAAKPPTLEQMERAARSGKADALTALGEAYNCLNRPADAEKAFRRALERSPESVSTLFGLGAALLHQGKRAEAVASWQAALKIAPGNYVIRKQIWVVEHPEKFYPTIDWEWQRQQLRN